MTRREKILHIELKEELVQVPEWEETLIVRELTAGQRSDLMGKSVKDGKTNLDVMTKELLLMCVRDPETKELVFTADDAQVLMEKSSSAIDRLISKAMKMSGLTEREEKAAEKN